MAEQLIGALISLVTKSDVRYEGFVSQINEDDSTLALRNVKSLGTEGRRKDGSQVPPSEGVYKYMYFKGTDIKDLHVKYIPHAQGTFDVPDDPAIVQSYLSPPTSSPVSLSTSGALQTTNISRNAQPTDHVPYLHGNHSLHSSIVVPLDSTLSPLTLDNSKPTGSTYWQGFHNIPSISQGLIASHPSQQKTNSSFMNEHLATWPAIVVEPHHSLIPPLSHGGKNGLQVPQKSPAYSSGGIPSMISPSATGSQNEFPSMSPGVQNGFCLVPQSSTIGSPSGLPSVPPPSAASSQNGFLPLPPLSGTNFTTPHERSFSQNSPQPVGRFSAISSPGGLPSLSSSSVTGSWASFPPLPPSPTTYFLSPPSSTGSLSGLRPMPLLPITGYTDARHSLPPSSAAVNGFSLSTPSAVSHSDAGLFSVPAISVEPNLLSNITFSGPSMPADLNTQVESSTSPHVNTVTTLVKEIASSVSGPVASCSSMLLSVKPTVETRNDFVCNNPIQPSGPLLQKEEQIRSPSSHSLLVINEYNPSQVSTSATFSSGPENVKDRPQQILQSQANKVQGATASSPYHKTYHRQRPRDETDRDKLQGRHSDPGYEKGRAKLGHHVDQGYGKGRVKLRNGAVLFAQYGYRTHAKPRGHVVVKDRDVFHGGHSDQGCGKGRGNLRNRASLHTQYGYRSHAKARRHEASHINKILGGDHRSNRFLVSTRHVGRGYPIGDAKALQPVQKFTEDFNFEAMNEKFNKEKFWGILNASTIAESEHKNGDGDKPESVEDGPVKVDNKPVYCKDDFFDKLSSSTVDQQTRRGRVKLSERKRIDSETFGEIKKHQRGRGIQGPLRAGGSQGSYRGRGYDHSGRGRERTVWSRDT